VTAAVPGCDNVARRNLSGELAAANKSCLPVAAVPPTNDPDAKFEPKVKAAPPAVVLVGERLLIVGIVGLVPLGTVDAPEPQPQMLAPIATAISTPMGTNLRKPLVLMTPS
jgi:hypothetical protein